MKNNLPRIAALVVLIGSLLGSAALFMPDRANATDILYFGGLPYTLAGSGITASATSFTLTSLTIPQNGYKVQDADLSSTFYVTFEPGSRTKQEFVSCTTVGSNTGSTVTISGCTRGLIPFYPYTASTTLAFSHSGGSTVTFSNPPQLYNDIIQYANALSFAGAPDASTIVKGLSELATTLETASSTASGTSGPLAIPATNATSTYNAATAGLRVVVTQNNGRIDTNFIAANSSSAASSSALTTDGAGNLTWNGNNHLLIASSSPVSVLGNAASTSIMSATIPANALGGSNTLHAVFRGSTIFMSTGETLSIEYSYGATATTTVTLIGPGSSQSGFSDLDLYIQANGSAAQRTTFRHNFVLANTASSTVATSTTAVDSTASQPFNIIIKPSNGARYFTWTGFLEILAH